jgi:serine O-acetyltransferase
VVVGAGAQVLGGFTVGDGARIGSNAVVVKPVPAGATAVGNPARVIEQKDEEAKKTAQSPCSETASSSQPESSVETGARSPCDSDWDAAPLQAMLNKGTAPQQPERKPQRDDNGAFTAYAVDPGASDPLVKVLHELITHTAEQDARIAQLCKTIESMGSVVDGKTITLDVQRLNRMVDE